MYFNCSDIYMNATKNNTRNGNRIIIVKMEINMIEILKIIHLKAYFFHLMVEDMKEKKKEKYIIQMEIYIRKNEKVLKGINYYKKKFILEKKILILFLPKFNFSNFLKFTFSNTFISDI